MRGLLWVPVLMLAGVSIGSCSGYDDDCSSDSDCHTGRVCRQGECRDADSGETSSSGFGGAASSSSVTSSSQLTATATATTGPPPVDAVPSCEGIESGVEGGFLPTGTRLCEPPIPFIVAEFERDSLLVSLDTEHCTLTQGGSECSATAADTYECGECTFKIYLTDTGEGTWRWAIAGASCERDACADYCCATSTGSYHSEYWLLGAPSPPAPDG